jgi:hypothetical protein
MDEHVMPRLFFHGRNAKVVVRVTDCLLFHTDHEATPVGLVLTIGQWH